MIISILKWILIVFVFIYSTIGIVEYVHEYFINEIKPDKEKIWKLHNWKFKKLLEKEKDEDRD